MSTHEPPPRPTKGWARTHESLFVPRERHLGTVGDCRKCGPYSRDVALDRELFDKTLSLVTFAVHEHGAGPVSTEPADPGWEDAYEIMEALEAAQPRPVAPGGRGRGDAGRE